MKRRERGQRAAWDWALRRASEGFERGGGEATPDRLRAAAKLELDLALGCLSAKPAAVCGLLDAVYSGFVDAMLLESGRVHVWATAGSRKLSDGTPRRTPS